MSNCSGHDTEMKKRKYDLIFSMGAACSCTAALRATELQMASYPFDWLFGSNLHGRANILTSGFERFIDIGDLEFAFSERSIYCDAYHNKYNDLTFNHDFATGIDLTETYPAVRAKYDRRINRLLTNIENAKSVLIVYIETPDNAEPMTNAKIKSAFDIIRHRWPNKVIDLVYFSPDYTVPTLKETKITENITRVVGNYKSCKENELSYAVNSSLLKKFFATHYVLEQSFFTRAKRHVLKTLIAIIPSHKTRVRMRKKYHLG